MPHAIVVPRQQLLLVVQRIQSLLLIVSQLHLLLVSPIKHSKLVVLLMNG